MVRAARGLVDAGWRAEVFLPHDGALVSTLEGIESVKVRVARFTVLRKALARPTGLIGLLLSVPFDLVRTIRRSGADVVYVNTVTIPVWIIAARLCRRPMLVHVRGAEADRPRLLQLALNAPMLLATRVVTNSNASRQVLTTSVPPLAARTSVLNNGIPDPGPASPIAPTGRVALVGRLSPRKGIDVALEAIAILRRAGQEVTSTSAARRTTATSGTRSSCAPAPTSRTCGERSTSTATSTRRGPCSPRPRSWSCPPGWSRSATSPSKACSRNDR
jgi:glycosyltransferase involved in cell wall biosynthesis